MSSTYRHAARERRGFIVNRLRQHSRQSTNDGAATDPLADPAVRIDRDRLRRTLNGLESLSGE